MEDKLFEKSLRTLELDRVLEMLAEGAVSRAAKERARALEPTDDLYTARERMSETAAAWRMTNRVGGPNLSAVGDCIANVRRAERGGSLSMPALLEVAALLGAVRRLKDYGDSDGAERGVLDGLFYGLQPNKYLEESITRAIIAEDEMADAASPELMSIRRKIRAAGSRVRETLQRMITSPTYSKHLQDTIITQRSGRYVVPVKSESKNEIPGLVHDVSSSGSTFFIEPAAVVELNNEIRELEVKERDEIERILAELSAEVGAHGEAIAESYNAYVALDLIFAKARLADRMRAAEPALDEGTSLDLKKARHPLIRREKVVPISVRLGGEFDTLVVTGPNTGGKTVTLKTLGLFPLMAACGLFIPAEEGSRVPVYGGVYADIGDEQSIEQSLSTFSSHMTNIVAILSGVRRNSLVLFDELGAGTDPVEGAALAVAVIQHARSLGASVAATTHYAELKEFALSTEGVENASCEFDVETLRPTYRLLIGVPGRSNAFAISRRLGLDESVIAAAESLVGSEDKRFDVALGRLEEEKQELEKLREEQSELRREAAEAANRARKFRSDAEKEKSRARERAQLEAQRIIADARAEADAALAEVEALREQLLKSISAEESARALNEARTAARAKLNAAGEKYAVRAAEAPQPKAHKPARPIAVGDSVKILATGATAVVTALPKDKNGKMTVAIGSMTISLAPSAVELAENAEKPKGYISAPRRPLGERAAKSELDLRGETVGEALEDVDAFLDAAVMAGLTSVTIIHGKGTGALRNAITEKLRSDRRVTSFRMGKYGEGESGVTIVEF